jgi:ubiquinone/menaquinone biosynthesis C-methylase UbiE
MSLRRRLYALAYDRMSAGVEQAGLAALRERLLPEADGRVLEIGGGTGANLPFYGSAVASLTIAEPHEPMARRLERRAGEHAPGARIVRAAAEELPFDAGSFDTVVSTLVLCGVDDQHRALREARRVLRPGGKLVFIEHVRSEDERTGRFQDRANPLNRLVACCDCNRRTLAAIEEAGFQVAQLERTAMPKAPRFVRPLIVGVATAPP